MKFYKHYIEELYSFLKNATTSSSDNPLQFRKNKTKSQYNLDRQTAKISALSSGNVSKYKFLTGKDVLPEKDFLLKTKWFNEVKDILEIFYYDTEKIKPNNEAQEKYLEKRKVVINRASKLYDKFLKISIRYDKQLNMINLQKMCRKV